METTFSTTEDISTYGGAKLLVVVWNNGKLFCELMKKGTPSALGQEQRNKKHHPNKHETG